MPLDPLAHLPLGDPQPHALEGAVQAGPLVGGHAPLGGPDAALYGPLVLGGPVDLAALEPGVLVRGGGVGPGLALEVGTEAVAAVDAAEAVAQGRVGPPHAVVAGPGEEVWVPRVPPPAAVDAPLPLGVARAGPDVARHLHEVPVGAVHDLHGAGGRGLAYLAPQMAPDGGVGPGPGPRGVVHHGDPAVGEVAHGLSDGLLRSHAAGLVAGDVARRDGEPRAPGVGGHGEVVPQHDAGEAAHGLLPALVERRLDEPGEVGRVDAHAVEVVLEGAQERRPGVGPCGVEDAPERRREDAQGLRLGLVGPLDEAGVGVAAPHGGGERAGYGLEDGQLQLLVAGPGRPGGGRDLLGGEHQSIVPAPSRSSTEGCAHSAARERAVASSSP